MKARLLEYLVCYECRCPFDLVSPNQQGDEILEGALVCRTCEKSYPVRGGIPRIIPNSIEESAKKTASAFGWQWNNLDPALQQSKFDSSEVFLDFIKPVESSFFENKLILDGGCGAGRFAMLAQEFGAKEVIGVDLSSSVEIAYEKTKHLPNVHIVQADIYNLPFAQQFNYIYSVGVLHHLPDPMRGFHSLMSHLKDKGSISFWVYGKENNEWLLKTIDPIRRRVTSKMPSWLLSGFCHLMAIGMFAVLKGIYGPANRYESLAWLRRRLFYNQYLFPLSQFEYSTIHAVIFDQLTPEIAFYIAREELDEWFLPAEFERVEVTSRNNNSWRGLGERISAQELASLR